MVLRSMVGDHAQHSQRCRCSVQQHQTQEATLDRQQSKNQRHASNSIATSSPRPMAPPPGIWKPQQQKEVVSIHNLLTPNPLPPHHPSSPPPSDSQARSPAAGPGHAQRLVPGQPAHASLAPSSVWDLFMAGGRQP